jgi:hypothetical protein
LAYTENTTISYNTAHPFGKNIDEQQHDLYINAEGGIISGSVASLNKFITPHSRLQSTSSSSSDLSTSSESSNIHQSNENLSNRKPTEVRSLPDPHSLPFSLLSSILKT